MACFNILVVYFLMSCTLSVNCELTSEKLLGGDPAEPEDFKYHVAIIGKRNNSNTNYLVCAGGIISDFYILSNAECFLDGPSQNLLKLRFYVIVGSENLKDTFDYALDVLYIYTLTRIPIPYKHYVAVLQLSDSLYLTINLHLQPLSLPILNESVNTVGRVAGYGFATIEEKKKHSTKQRPIITSKKDYPLMYADVTIDDGSKCTNSYPHINPLQEMCGTIEARGSQHRGLCNYEEGAPLVVGEYVVGIANKNRRDCNNTIHGHLYTKVTFYLDFILGITLGCHIKDTVVHLNRPHLLYV